MPNTLGSTTQTIIFKGFHGDNLYEQFEAGANVLEGQMLKIDTDGTVVPIINTTPTQDMIGIAMMSAVDGKKVTVAMRGFGTIMAEGSASMEAGPVKFASFTTGTGLNRVDNVVATATVYAAPGSGGSPTVALVSQDQTFLGWALDPTVTAGDLTRVVIKN